MRKNIWHGKLVLFEGLDGAGKTSVMLEVMKNIDGKINLLYCKGVGSDTFWGRTAKRFAKTFLFLLELLDITYFSIEPALKAGKIILQDKYIFFVASHIPDVEKRLNKALIKLVYPLLFEPDLIFYFQVSPEERIRRLEGTALKNRFHEMLIDNPWLILEREKKYQELLSAFQNKVICVDTTGKSVSETASVVERELKKFVKGVTR